MAISGDLVKIIGIGHKGACVKCKISTAHKHRWTKAERAEAARKRDNIFIRHEGEEITNTVYRAEIIATLNHTGKGTYNTSKKGVEAAMDDRFLNTPFHLTLRNMLFDGEAVRSSSAPISRVRTFSKKLTARALTINAKQKPSGGSEKCNYC